MTEIEFAIMADRQPQQPPCAEIRRTLHNHSHTAQLIQLERCTLVFIFAILSRRFESYWGDPLLEVAQVFSECLVAGVWWLAQGGRHYWV